MKKVEKVEVLIIVSHTELRVFTNDNYQRFRLKEYGFNPKAPVKRGKNHITHLALIKDVRRFIRESNSVLGAYLYGVDVIMSSKLPITKYAYKMQLGFGEKVAMGLSLVMFHKREGSLSESIGVSNMGIRSKTKPEDKRIFY